ncbi:MAG: hypothetical protein ACK8QZ_05735 [Anaerolineales bacterium]
MKAWNNFVLGTAVAVVAGIILWVLEPYKTDFPKWGIELFDFVWAPVPLPRALIAIVAIAVGFLLFEFWATSQDKTKQAAHIAKAPAVPPTLVARALPKNFDVGPAQNLTTHTIHDDEEKVLAALTQFGDSADAKKLLQTTGLTEFRFEHAVGSLRRRFYIDDFSGYGGRGISFKQAGRDYAAYNDLDRR